MSGKDIQWLILTIKATYGNGNSPDLHPSTWPHGLKGEHLLANMSDIFMFNTTALINSISLALLRSYPH